MQTKEQQVNRTNICVARKSVANGMAAMIAEVKYPPEQALRCVLRQLNCENVW
jgi:hypothetical protein